ncbi:MAG: hypothetical protein KGP28_01290 [Bdellovibrionales bacterium]|nr:hypothetical protein [Bdellovibrionales bacterium]
MEKPPRVVPRPKFHPPAPEKDRVRPVWYKRQYLVYPRFQLTLIILNTLITTGLFTLTVFLVMRSHLFLETLVRQTRLPAQGLFIQLMTEQLRTLIFYMVVAFVVAVLSTAVLTMLISHRMAGPIKRLNGFFSQIEKTGEFPQEIRFRDGDFFQELPPRINQAFLAIKKRWLR